MSERVRTTIHCHACDNNIGFRLDLRLNGNHVLKCPKCGHEHCRVVKGGKITDIRWDTRNGPTHYIRAPYILLTGSATSSTATSYTSTSFVLATM